MTWTNPRSWTTGEVVTAAILNAHVRDNLLETAPAKVTTAGDLLVATGANALKRLALGTGEYTLRVNAGGTDVEWSAKSLFTGTDAGKGAAATADRVWVATDTKIIYYDTGVAWIEIGRAASVIGAGDLGFDPATQTELSAHATAATIDHPAGSVGDTALGNRTADPTIATAYALAGTVTQHLSWLTKNIKALKGVAGNWYDAANATIEGIWAKFDASTGHKHTGTTGDAPGLSFADLSDFWVTPGNDNTFLELLTERSTGDTRTLYIVLKRPGMYRITGDLKVNNAIYQASINVSGIVGTTVYAVTAAGFSTSSTIYVPFEIDMTKWIGQGDCVIITLTQSSSGTSYLQNLRLKGNAGTEEDNYLAVEVNV